VHGRGSLLEDSSKHAVSAAHSFDCYLPAVTEKSIVAIALIIIS